MYTEVSLFIFCHLIIPLTGSSLVSLLINWNILVNFNNVSYDNNKVYIVFHFVFFINDLYMYHQWIRLLHCNYRIPFWLSTTCNNVLNSEFLNKHDTYNQKRVLKNAKILIEAGNQTAICTNVWCTIVDVFMNCQKNCFVTNFSLN